MADVLYISRENLNKFNQLKSKFVNILIGSKTVIDKGEVQSWLNELGTCIEGGITEISDTSDTPTNNNGPTTVSDLLIDYINEDPTKIEPIIDDLNGRPLETIEKRIENIEKSVIKLIKPEKRGQSHVRNTFDSKHKQTNRKIVNTNTYNNLNNRRFVKCRTCHKNGHISRECYQNQNRQENTHLRRGHRFPNDFH